MKFSTQPGQQLFISGDCDFLGFDILDDAASLQYYNDEFWRFSFEVNAKDYPEEINYRYLLQFEDGSRVIEGENHHSLLLSSYKAKVLDVYDVWNHAGTIDNVFFTQPFTDGTLDNSFGIGGMQTTNFGSNSVAAAIAIQSNGEIVLTGSVLNGSTTDFALARYNRNGNPDNSFSGDGKLTTDFGPNSGAIFITIESDGKIIAIGSVDDVGNFGSLLAIARYNADGSADNSFSDDGKRTNDLVPRSFFNAAAIQTDGKIVAAGTIFNESTHTENFALIRYNIDGSLDNSFSEDGQVSTPFFRSFEPDAPSSASALAIQSDGKIVAAGNFGSNPKYDANIAIARYNADGSLDNNFSDDGQETIINNDAYDQYFTKSIVLQKDG